jgi:hypothetical protein
MDVRRKTIELVKPLASSKEFQHDHVLQALISTSRIGRSGFAPPFAQAVEIKKAKLTFGSAAARKRIARSLAIPSAG